MKKLLLVFLIFILAAQLLGLSLVYASNDPVGNITEIDDNSYTDARKLATFAYDDLYRLTSASSTDAGVELYYETYAYDSIGNITNKSDQGTYTYNDDGYNNPHAADSIDGVNLAYDNAGNLTSDGNLTLVWDYRNRLASASSTTDSITYAYDHNNQRTEITNGSSTTVYPNKLYNTDGTTETKHIFDHEGTVIATAETAASSTQVYYNHPDHLTGSNVVSNEDGALEQTLDYYPFGGIRVNDRNSVFDEQRKFTGQEYDDDTNLHYYVQRYYNQDVGRFVSQDSAFLAIGGFKLDEIIARVEEDENKNLRKLSESEKDRQTLQGFLSNPQHLNAYSYTVNNPLKYTDPNGEFEVHINLTTNVGAGASGGNTWSFGFASDGSYGVSVGWNAGAFIGADVSIGGEIGYSNAETWSDSVGKNVYLGGGGKLLVGGGADLNFSGEDGSYSGLDVGLGLGLSTPVYAGAGVGDSTVVIDRNIKQDLHNIIQGISNLVNSTADYIKKNTDDKKSKNDKSGL